MNDTTTPISKVTYLSKGIEIPLAGGGGGSEPTLNNIYGTWRMLLGTTTIDRKMGENTYGEGIIGEPNSELAFGRYLVLHNLGDKPLGLSSGEAPTIKITFEEWGTAYDDYDTGITHQMVEQTEKYSSICSASYRIDAQYGSTGSAVSFEIFENCKFSQFDLTAEAHTYLEYAEGETAILLASEQQLDYRVTSLIQNGVELLASFGGFVFKENGVADYFADSDTQEITYTVTGDMVEVAGIVLTYKNENGIETLGNTDAGMVLNKLYYPTRNMTINANGTYSGVAYGGFEDVVVDIPEKKDMLQQKVDISKSCDYLMHSFKGDNVDFIKDLDTSNVTTMKYAFYLCSNITTIPQLDTSNVTDMYYMFTYCSTLTTIPQLDTSNVTDMSGMFRGCPALTAMPVLDTSNVQEMDAMFLNCKSLKTIDELNTSNVTTMQSTFSDCSALSVLPNLNTSKVKFFYRAFENCISLTDIPELDTINATSMEYMCQGCTNLISIHLLNLINTTKTTSMFNDCTNLTNLTLKNIKVNLQIGSGTTWGHLLTLDSLINTVKELWDYSSGTTTYTLTMGTANLEKITNTYVKLITPTAEQIADDPNIENKKPCEVCESTDEGAMTLETYANLKGWELA